jgi:hypothetical protein
MPLAIEGLKISKNAPILTGIELSSQNNLKKGFIILYRIYYGAFK